jgi:hypothetical protein
MTARCCGCGRALELGKNLFTRSTCLPFELAILVGKKRKKKEKRKKHLAGLLTWPALGIPCLDAGTPPPWRPCAYSSKLALLPCHTSAPLFMDAVCTTLTTPPRNSHIPFKTQRQFNVEQTYCVVHSGWCTRTQGLKGWATARGSRGWLERKRRAPTSMPRRAAGHGGSAS